MRGDEFCFEGIELFRTTPARADRTNNCAMTKDTDPEYPQPCTPLLGSSPGMLVRDY